jgi:peptidoglycan/LPS O-acetylase OafA/YrhL
LATYKGDSDLYVLSQTLLFNFRNELVPQSWSLSVELIASLLLPYLFMVYRKNKSAFYYLIFISLFLYNGVNQSQSSALGFTINFLLGIFLSDLFLHEKFLNKKYFLLIFPFIIFSFSARWSIDWFPNIKYYVQVMTDFLNMDFHQLFYFISAFGSFLLIYFVISTKFIQHILSNILLVFIGKISFSIYLIHFLIIQVSYNEIVGFLKPIQNSLLESVLSIFTQLLIILLAAAGSYYLIEKPLIDFSKKKANIWFAKQ